MGTEARVADSQVKKLAVEQRKRLIAGLLNAVESTPWYKQLNEAQRREYRGEVMTRVGIYHDFMLDVIKVASDDDAVVNERALELLEQVHAGQRSLERAVSGRSGG